METEWFRKQVTSRDNLSQEFRLQTHPEKQNVDIYICLEAQRKHYNYSSMNNFGPELRGSSVMAAESESPLSNVVSEGDGVLWCSATDASDTNPLTLRPATSPTSRADLWNAPQSFGSHLLLIGVEFDTSRLFCAADGKGPER